MTTLAAMPGWGCTVLGTAFLVAIGLALLDRLALWAESRGWIYWRKRKRSSRGGGGGAMGGFLTEFQRIVEPQTQSRIEIVEERRTEASERVVRGDAVDPPTVKQSRPPEPHPGNAK